MRSFSLLALGLAASAQAQNWATEHHDNRNSGQTNLIGPAERNGTCEAPIIEGSELSNSPHFWSSGVLSSTNEYLYAGDSNNVLNLVETEKFLVNWLNLTLFWPAGYAPVTNYGVVASGSNHRILVQQTNPSAESSLLWTDRLYVPSADGTVYALDPLQCNAPPAPSTALKAKLSSEAVSLAQTRHNAVLEATRAASRQAPGSPSLYQTDLPTYQRVLTEKLSPLLSSSSTTKEEVAALTATPCLVWQRSFTQPVYAPLRYVSPSPDYPSMLEGLVIASETDPGMDAGGILHGIDAHTGALLWSIAAVYTDKENAQQHAGIRSVPAVFDVLTPAFNASAPGAPASGFNQTYIGFMGFGTRLIAFDVFTGRIAADVNTTAIQQNSPNGPGGGGGGVGGTDIFVSAPTLSTDGSALYVHSSMGTLWKVAVGGWSTYPNTGKISLSFQWACEYTLQGSRPTICDTITNTQSTAADVASFVYITKERTRAVDVVTGGFYQPTTREDRGQLYQLLLDEYKKTFPAPANPADVSAATLANGAGMMTYKEASRIARALPYATVASLKTASGYQLLAPNSRTAASMLSVETTTAIGRRRLALDPEAVVGLTRLQQRQLALELGAQENVDAPADLAAIRARLANKYGFIGVFPFATPSLQPPNDAVIVLAQYGSFGLDSALYAANAADGTQKWNLVNVTSPDGRKIAFGKSRSSPGIDANGAVYAGTDSDDGPYTLPIVLATDANGKFTWLTGLDTDNVLVGSSSPIVAAGFLAEKRVYMSDGYGLQAIDEGYACPGALDPFTPCSGNGVCQCQVGKCVCSNRCFSGDDCSVPKNCGATGHCVPETGKCVCDDPCFTGPNCDVARYCGNGKCDSAAGGCVCNNCWLKDKTGACTIANTCSGRGSCSHFTGQCKCTDSFCYSGPNCEMVNPCGGHGTCGNSTCSCFPNYSSQNGCQTCDACHSGFTSGCVTLTNDCSGQGTCNPLTGSCACNAGYTGDSCSSKAGSNGGAVAAGIIIPSLLLGLGGALFWWKRKNPGKPMSDILPSMPSWFNFGRTRYTKMGAYSAPASAASPGLSSGFISRQSSGRAGAGGATGGSELASYGSGKKTSLKASGGGYGSYGT